MPIRQRPTEGASAASKPSDVNEQSLIVAVQYASTSHEVPAPAQFEAWVRAAVGASARGEIGIRIVDEDESAALNLRFRGREGATNVLAFDSDGNLRDLDPDAPIGDIVICAPVVAREAAEQGKASEAHWAHLAVHGVLHLLGFGHDSDADAARMEHREAEVLAAIGYDDPYEAAD
jgi:probable rRNA maturation factor